MKDANAGAGKEDAKRPNVGLGPMSGHAATCEPFRSICRKRAFTAPAASPTHRTSPSSQTMFSCGSARTYRPKQVLSS